MSAATMSYSHPRYPQGRQKLPLFVRDALWSVLAVLLSVVAGLFAFKKLDVPVDQLAVQGAQRHVRPEEIRDALLPLVEQPLLQVNLAEARTMVESLPWVADARVDRVWPAQIAVRVREREVFARWGDQDALSTEGIIFATGEHKLSKILPRLHGPEGREQELMEMYRQLSDRLAETPFAPTGLIVDARGDWSATTRSGVLLRFGREQPLSFVERLKNIVLPELGSRLNQVARVDLRYANGFAVAWKRADSGNPLIPVEPLKATLRAVAGTPQ